MKHSLRLLVSAGLVALAGAATPALAGKSDDTLVWATDKEVNTIIPRYNNLRETVIMNMNVWDTLVYRDPKTFEYRPLIAKSWKWLDDTTLEFELHRGIKFHDGSALDAEDVVATYNHFARPDSAVLSRSYVDWIAKAEKVDDDTVRVKAKEPFPAALEMVSLSIPILPSDIWDKAKKDATGKPDWGTVPPIGSGPYKVAEFVPSQTVKMVRFEDYFPESSKPKPKIKNLVFRTITDKETQVAELITGGVDWIWDVPKDRAEELQQMPAVKVVNADTMRVSYIGMDAAGRAGKTPFNDIRVRKAVAHAIDRQAIVRNLVGGEAQVVNAPCYPTQVGCTDDVPKYDYDPEKAKKLLAEAGYPNGFDTDIYAYRERHFTEATMGYLAKVGIRTNLKYMQFQALRGLVWEGKTPFFHMTWGSDSVNDITGFTSLFFEGGRDDYCRDEQVIAWLKEGDATIDPDKRKAVYQKALSRIMELACWLPMFTYSKYYAFNGEMSYTPSPDEIARFYEASWK